MKFKLVACFALGTVLAVGGVRSISVLGQGFPPGASNGDIYAMPRYSPNVPNPMPRYGPNDQNANPPPFMGMPLPNPGFANGRPLHAFIVKKDGTIERIDKEQGVPFTPEEMGAITESRQKLQEAISTLRSPDSNEATRKEAKDFFVKYLKADFKADQESRKAQVDRLEKQVEQLRKQLAKREESQDKLIELRMQLLENDASGLSFPESWSNLSGPQSAGGSGGTLYAPSYPSPFPLNYGPAYPAYSTSPYPSSQLPVPSINAEPKNRGTGTSR